MAQQRPVKDKFIIEPHFRLQEWVADRRAISRRKASTMSFRS
jgi:hypothetical protein